MDVAELGVDNVLDAVAEPQRLLLGGAPSVGAIRAATAKKTIPLMSGVPQNPQLRLSGA